MIGGAFLVGGGGMPFLVAGGLKIVHDLLLYRAFRRSPPPGSDAGR